MGLLRTCHKGEPKRLRLRMGESGVRGEEGPSEYLDEGTLGCTELPSEEMLCLRNKDGCRAYETLGRCRNEAGCGEQGRDKGGGSPAGPTLAFPASFVGEGPPGLKEPGGAEAGGLIKAP